SGIFVTSQELEPRSYTLVITATGYVEWYGVATVYNGPAETEVRMQPVTEGVLTITVIVGTTDAVIPNATVTVSRSGTSEEYSGTTNSAGIYTSPTLSTGRYDIEVTADGYNPELYGSVDVDGDTSKDIYLSKPQPGFLTIKVVDEDTQLSLPGVTVKITDEASGNVIEANDRTYSNGTYTSSLLASGAYTIELTRVGYWPVESSRHMKGDATVYFSMLEKRDATFTAYVNDHETLDA